MIPDQTNSERRMKICDHAVVAMHYTLKNGEGVVLDSSEGQDPLTYLHGTGGIITGLEAALLDKSAGDQFTAVIEPEMTATGRSILRWFRLYRGQRLRRR